MKKLCILTMFLFTLPLMADEIHLNDGTIIRGRIIQVTPDNIEYDPDDNRNFSLVPRGQIKKLVYDDGNVVELNEGMIPVLPEEQPAEPDIKIPKQPVRETRKAPAAPRTEEGAETHDGFFLRFQYGLGGARATILDYAGEDMEYSGACDVLQISPGFTVSPNLALFGVLGADTSQTPYYVNNCQNTEHQLLYAGNAVFDLSMQGPQEQVGFRRLEVVENCLGAELLTGTESSIGHPTDQAPRTPPPAPPSPPATHGSSASAASASSVADPRGAPGRFAARVASAEAALRP